MNVARVWGWVRRRTTAFWVATFLVVYTISTASTFAYILHQNDQRCLDMTTARHEQEQMWVDIATELHARPLIVATIREHFDRLPPITDC